MMKKKLKCTNKKLNNIKFHSKVFSGKRFIEHRLKVLPRELFSFEFSLIPCYGKQAQRLFFQYFGHIVKCTPVAKFT